jgi:hypothetical protein
VATDAANVTPRTCWYLWAAALLGLCAWYTRLLARIHRNLGLWSSRPRGLKGSGTLGLEGVALEMNDSDSVEL